MARRESIDSRRAMLMCEGALRLRGEEVGEHSRCPARPTPSRGRSVPALPCPTTPPESEMLKTEDPNPQNEDSGLTLWKKKAKI